MSASRIRDTTVLTKADWDRIQYQLNKRAILQEEMRKEREEKERLRELSRQKVSTWTNTIQVGFVTKLNKVII